MQYVCVVTIFTSYNLCSIVNHTYTVITILHTQCYDAAVQSDWLKLM